MGRGAGVPASPLSTSERGGASSGGAGRCTWAGLLSDPAGAGGVEGKVEAGRVAEGASGTSCCLSCARAKNAPTVKITAKPALRITFIALAPHGGQGRESHYGMLAGAIWCI